MRIKLKVHLTGTRNGQEWPSYGQEIELPDQEARDMVAAGMAEPIATHREAETAIPRSATAAEERGVEATREALVPKGTLKGGAKK